MTSNMDKDLYQKILAINLDNSIYGTFAEIGAGQETANLFFKVSGAAGTVAKTISAYDMTISDTIYGKVARYVSQERLRAMLDYEYKLLVERLAATRGANTRFFSFCNTVKAKAYHDDGNWHGWLGVRFQLKPEAPPSDLIVHVRMLDYEHDAQMEALGILGVNMLDAVYNYCSSLSKFVSALGQGLGNQRIELDMVRLEGHGFEMLDNRLLAIELIQQGLMDAALFTVNGEVVQPAEALYKKSVLLMRGSFDPVINLHLYMMQQARQAFLQQQSKNNDCSECVEICEISLNNLLRGSSLDLVDYLDRIDALQALGKNVLVSKFAEFHRLSAFLSRYTQQPTAIVLSIGLLNELFKHKWSAKLPGGVLESFGRLFKNKLQLYVVPWRNRHNNELVDAANFRAPEGMEHLYEYFCKAQLIVGVEFADQQLLRYTSRDIQNMIENDDRQWKEHVPEQAQRSAQHLRRGNI